MVNEQKSQVRQILRRKTPDGGEPAGTVKYEFSGLAPIILPGGHGEHEGFSAWTYSDHFVSINCKTL